MVNHKKIQSSVLDNEKQLKKQHQINEDVPTNNAGLGQIAGIGIGSQGEPGVDLKKRKKKRKTFVEFIRRKTTTENK